MVQITVLFRRVHGLLYHPLGMTSLTVIVEPLRKAIDGAS
jgi:hypothetical protein